EPKPGDSMDQTIRSRSSRSTLRALAGAAVLLAAAAAQAANPTFSNSMIQPPQQTATARVAVVAPSKAPAAIPQELPQQSAADIALEAVGAGDMLHITVFRNP